MLSLCQLEADRIQAGSPAALRLGRRAVCTSRHTCFLSGSNLATFFQMAPVPPSRGNLQGRTGAHCICWLDTQSIVTLTHVFMSRLPIVNQVRCSRHLALKTEQHIDNLRHHSLMQACREHGSSSFCSHKRQAAPVKSIVLTPRIRTLAVRIGLDGAGLPEDGVGTPAGVLLAFDDAPDGARGIHSGDPLAQPLALHGCGREGPDLHRQKLPLVATGRLAAHFGKTLCSMHKVVVLVKRASQFHNAHKEELESRTQATVSQTDHS